ncbi:MAG: TolC family protein [Methylovulum sp.]|nr:TolC family protein [Methylovulum sp.]
MKIIPSRRVRNAYHQTDAKGARSPGKGTRCVPYNLILMAFVLLLSGCAHFQDKPLSPNDSALRLEARTLDSAGLHQFIAEANKHKNAWPPAAWNLDDLTLAAMYYHPDLALARAQADITDATNVTAAQRINPNMTITPTWISNAVPPAIPWIVASSLSIPIETAGKRGYRIDKSKHLTEAAQLRIADAAWLVRGRLRLALLDVYAAQEALRLLQQQSGIEQTIDRQLQQQQVAGEISNTDLLVAQLGLNHAQLAVTAAQKKLAESKAMLAAAIGVPVSALTRVALDFTELAKLPDIHDVPVDKLREVALRERPDILATLAEYAAAQSALQLEIANQYPNIQVNPGYAWDVGAHYWVLGANALQLPLFHQNQGLIAESETKRQAVAVRFEALQLRVLGEIDRAHASLLAVHERWAAAEQGVHNRQENLRSARDLLQAGELDAHAVEVAELEQSVAERARLDVLFESQQALAMLEAALHYPLPFTNQFMSTPALRKTLQ